MTEEKTIIVLALLKHRAIDESTNCWLWTGLLYSNGYGRFTENGYDEKVHRLIMGAEEGEQINHKRNCPNRNCFNPEHLYKGSQKENINDAVALNKIPLLLRMHHCLLKTHCPAGHKYDRNIATTGYRYCSICKKEQSHRNYRNKHKSKALYER